MSRPPQTLKNFFSTIVENDDQKRARIEREAQRAELQLEAIGAVNGEKMANGNRVTVTTLMYQVVVQRRSPVFAW